MKSLLLLLVLPGFTVLQAADAPAWCGTFSIIAVDVATGEIGVAVASRVVGVGAIVPFAKAGVGAVATQSFANLRYGPVGLVALELKIDPGKALTLLTADDPLREERQVGLINAAGLAANYTGASCLSWAGGIAGDGFSVQGNILTGPEVLAAMAEAFTNTGGELSERLLAALHAGEDAGGDQRGKQSAALLVVREGWGYGGLSDRFRDIRVDEHPEPVQELERVYRAHCKLFPRPDPKP
jgi:uncharacterized Ntn-hydrolase superfamily protein